MKASMEAEDPQEEPVQKLLREQERERARRPQLVGEAQVLCLGRWRQVTLTAPGLLGFYKGSSVPTAEAGTDQLPQSRGNATRDVKR